MDLQSVQNALKSWVGQLSGLPATSVIWQNEPRGFTTGATAILSWVSRTGIGIDETDWTFDDSGAVSGAGAITGPGAAAGDVRITGLSGITNAMLGYFVTFSNATSGGNNGTFPISAVNDPTSIDVTNAGAVQPDANNGHITWAVRVPNATASTIMQRKLTLQVSFETNDQLATLNSAFFAEAMRERVYSVSSIETLKTANLGLIDADDARQSDYKLDQRWISRTLIEIRFNSSSVTIDTASARGTIDSVLVTSQITAPDGSLLPDAEQLTNKAMP